MKKYLPYSLILAAAATGLAHGAATAYTTPVGYVTSSLPAEKYTLISVTAQNPTIAAGVIDAESATPKSLTDNQVNFTTLLTPGAVYILELPNGVIQEITSWTGSVLTTQDDVTSSVIPGTTTYNLRLASTVSSIFGAQNSAGLKTDSDEDYANNDLILIPNSVNAFDTVYYFNGSEGAGWYDIEGNPADNKVINYGDGVFVSRQAGSPLSLVVSGEVKTKPTSGVLVPGFNFLGAVSPVGLTLGTSGLKDFLSFATNETQVETSDLVQTQVTPGGAYRSAYYFNDGSTVGWFDLEGNPADEMALSGGFLIENKGSLKPYTLSVPAAYTSL